MKKMQYDFDRIGKEQVLNSLIHKLNNKANHLKTKNVSAKEKLDTLKEIQEISRDAHNILNSLQTAPGELEDFRDILDS